MSWRDRIFTRPVREAAEAAARAQTDIMGRALPIPGSAAERSAEIVGRAVVPSPVSRLAVESLLAKRDSVLAEIRAHEIDRPPNDSMFYGQDQDGVPPVVADWHAKDSQLQEQLGMIDTQLRSAYRQVTGVEPLTGTTRDADIASILSALNQRPQTAVRNSMPDRIRAAKERLAAQGPAVDLPPEVAAQARALEDAIRNAATVRVSGDPTAPLEVSPFEIAANPAVRRLLDGPAGPTLLNSLSAKLGVSGQNIELEVLEAVRKNVLESAREGATSAGARPSGLAGAREPRNRAYEQSAAGETKVVRNADGTVREIPAAVPATTLADTQPLLEDFVPIVASRPVRVVRQLEMDPATGRPILDENDMPTIPRVSDDTLPSPGSAADVQMRLGNYRPDGVSFVEPRGPFAGRRRVVNGKETIEPDLNKPLLELVQRRTGGDGNRSTEARMYLLTLDNGRYQVMASDPVTGEMLPPSVTDRAGLDRMLAEGWQPSDASKEFHRQLWGTEAPELRSPLESQTPEGVGAAVLGLAREGSEDAASIRAALDAVRNYRLYGTKADFDALLSEAGNGLREGGYAALELLERNLAGLEEAGLRDVPASAAERRAMSESEQALGRLRQARLESSTGSRDVTQPVTGANVSVAAAGNMLPVAGRPSLVGRDVPQASIDLASPSGESFSIDAASPYYRSVFQGSETRGGTAVDDNVIPGAAVDAAAQGIPASALTRLGPLDELLTARGMVSPLRTMQFTVTPNSWAANLLSGADEPAAARLARAAQLADPFTQIASAGGGAGRSLNFAEAGVPTAGVGVDVAAPSPVQAAKRMADDALKDRLAYLLERRGPESAADRDARIAKMRAELDQVKVQRQKAQDASYEDPAFDYAKLDELLEKERTLTQSIEADSDPALLVAHADLTREINSIYDELRMRGVQMDDIAGQIKAARSAPEEIGALDARDRVISAARYPPQAPGEDAPIDYDPAVRREGAEFVRDEEATRGLLRDVAQNESDPRRIPIGRLQDLWASYSKRVGAKRVSRPPAMGGLDARPAGSRITESQVARITDDLQNLQAQAAAKQAEFDELQDTLQQLGPDEKRAARTQLKGLKREIDALEVAQDELVSRFGNDSAFAVDSAGENQARLTEAFMKAKPGTDTLSVVREMFSTPYSDPAQTFAGIRSEARARGEPEPSDQEIVFSALMNNPDVRRSYGNDYVWDVAGRAAQDMSSIAPATPKPTFGPAPKPAPVAQPGPLRRIMDRILPLGDGPMLGGLPRPVRPEPAMAMDPILASIPSGDELRTVTGKTYRPQLDGGVSAESAARLKAMEDRIEAIDKEIDAGLGSYDEAPDRRLWLQQQRELRSNNPERIALLRQYQPELDQFRRDVATGAVSRINEAAARIPTSPPVIDPQGFIDNVGQQVRDAQAAARSVIAPSGNAPTQRYRTDAERRYLELKEELRGVEPDSEDAKALMARYEEARSALPADSDLVEQLRRFEEPTPVMESRPANVPASQQVLSSRPKDDIVREMQPIYAEMRQLQDEIRERSVNRMDSAFDQQEHLRELRASFGRLRAELARGGHSLRPGDLVTTRPEPKPTVSAPAAPLKNLGYDIHLPEDQAAALQARFASPENAGNSTFEVRELPNGRVEVSMFSTRPISAKRSGDPTTTRVRIGTFTGNAADPGAYRAGHQTLRFDETGNAVLSKTGIPQKPRVDESAEQAFERAMDDPENADIVETARSTRRVTESPRESLEDKGTGAEPPPRRQPWNAPSEPTPGRADADAGTPKADPTPQELASSSPKPELVDASVREVADPAPRQSSQDQPKPKDQAQQGGSRLAKYGRRAAYGLAGYAVLDQAGVIPDPSTVAGFVSPLLMSGMVAGPVGGYEGEPDPLEDTNPEEIAARVRRARTPYFIAGNILPR